MGQHLPGAFPIAFRTGGEHHQSSGSANTSSILWVRHTHAGHHELHFAIPRQELASGKAFNLCPPGWQEHFDVFQSLHNCKEGWASPDNPAHAKTHPHPDPRKAVHAFVEQRVNMGLVANRQDIVRSLEEVGVKIVRTGKDYLTFIDPETEKRCRLKGGIYDADWNPERMAAITTGNGNWSKP